MNTDELLLIKNSIKIIDERFGVLIKTSLPGEERMQEVRDAISDIQELVTGVTNLYISEAVATLREQLCSVRSEKFFIELLKISPAMCIDYISIHMNTKRSSCVLAALVSCPEELLTIIEKNWNSRMSCEFDEDDEPNEE